MSRQIIDIGTLELNGSDGDTNRAAATKTNENFEELYQNNASYVRGPSQVLGGEVAVFSGTTGRDLVGGGILKSAAFTLSGDYATAAQGAKADAAQVKLVPGANIQIDDTDPANPIISATGGGTSDPTAWGQIVGTLADQTDLVAALNQKLSVTGTAAAAVKLATPVTINGQSFDGSQNITVVDSSREPLITAGTAAQYWTGSKAWADLAPAVRAVSLAGLDTSTNAVITATDTVLSGLGRLQKQISDAVVAIGNKAAKGANSDITSLSGLTTPLSVAQGGTGSATGVPTLVGATASTAGVKGLVPAPAAGDQTKFLRADGTWQDLGIVTVTNANGTAVKFPDGTMICTGLSATSLATSLATGGGCFFSAALSLTYPVAFTTSPRVSLSCVEAVSNFCWICGDVGTVNALTTTNNFRAASFSGSATTKVSYIAVGRWS